jgi:uncharacterized protein YeaO (DUF488 family)
VAQGNQEREVDLWIKELGTPREVIKKWKSGEIPWSKVAKEYRKALQRNQVQLLDLVKLSKEGDITLLCSCKDPEKCHRTLLAREIAEMQ